jgi:hypothetical protein
MKKARQAGLDAILLGMRPKPAAVAEEVKAPPAEPTDEEIHGIDVLNIEDAVKELWKARHLCRIGPWAARGPVVKLASRNLEKAELFLKQGGYL